MTNQRWRISAVWRSFTRTRSKPGLHATDAGATFRLIIILVRLNLTFMECGRGKNINSPLAMSSIHDDTKKIFFFNRDHCYLWTYLKFCVQTQKVQTGILVVHTNSFDFVRIGTVDMAPDHERSFLRTGRGQRLVGKQSTEPI